MRIQDLYELYRQSAGVCTDTRKIRPGVLFFALKGDRFDANTFAADALAAGAAFAIIDDPARATDARMVVVPDVLAALQDLARYHRHQLHIPVIGLTGSNGKTTSKELVNAVLAKKFKTFATVGNLNNHIGVPLTILSIDSSVELAIVEMGANHLGEIASLSSIAQPTHGFITNIGKAHIGTFGGFENIIRGKSELYQHLLTTNGVVFINSQNPILANMAKRFRNPIFYPAKGDYYHCELVSADPTVVVRTEEGATVATHLVGAYNFENIATALCIGKYFGVLPSDAEQAIAAYVPSNMRSQVIGKGTNTVILDAYNANPSSMEAALRNLALMKAKNKLAIIGDMYELADETVAEHERVGHLLAELRLPAWVCGAHMQHTAHVNPAVLYFPDKLKLVAHAQANPVGHTTVLIKASRGMGLETILEYL
ncbi:MAG: UDP-N-acetylmuramoyl-tripeptide--D-alanyl-D-alanine ligase [Cyclobacteriaceae bacterium]|jgi:UDP-N-acetylmuramoyl-tripeptide--D-alanyl-D-alanine ligase|nr:UDP-N-acetylmuramoyl-tripeptide--D-alanyl-D-alanine ligase [Flammeovirgaceae bacterium]